MVPDGWDRHPSNHHLLAENVRRSGWVSALGKSRVVPSNLPAEPTAFAVRIWETASLLSESRDSCPRAEIAVMEASEARPCPSPDRGIPLPPAPSVRFLVFEHLSERLVRG